MKHTLLLFFLIIINSTFSQNKNQTIGFKENKGQIIDQKGKPNTTVKYLLNSNGLNVQLKKNGFSYDVYEVKKTPVVRDKTSKTLPYIIPEKDKETKPEYNLEYIFHRIDIDFVNSNSKVELITDQKSNDFDNYYNVPNKPEGITGVYQYKQITYKNIYPNIDVIFSVPTDPKKTIEYNFVIHPKGKISDIQLKFNGAETDLVDNKIQMNVRFGKMEEMLPASWIEDGGSKKEIEVSYKKIKKNVYGFDNLSTASDKTVIIDPVPVRLWGTYYGGEGEENYYNGLVKTNNQFVYIGGYTNSFTNISTSGSYQPDINFPNDAFIAKFDANGQKVWSTYYGGNGTDSFRAIDFDLKDNIYAVGETTSETNIATPGTNQTSYIDWYDGIVVKFNENGQRIWGSYYGGEGVDGIVSIKVDHDQNIFIAGFSQSMNNISTPYSFKPIASSNTNVSEDGFLAKLTPQGQRIWATFYGGDGNDSISSIDIDSNNNIFCSGTTSSFNGISTIGAYDETFNYDTMLWNDTFIVKFNTNGVRLFGTYYGGLDYDMNSSIKIDKQDNFVITGCTRSIDGIGTTNSFQPNNGGKWDSYLAKFSNNGDPIWSTFYGGQEDDGLTGKNSIEIDETNSIYFFSNGLSSSHISTVGVYQENMSGFNNLYIVKFTPGGERIWGTYYGGQISDYSGDISYEKNGVFYISGWTYSSTEIASSDGFQTDLKGTSDSFLIKFQDCTSNLNATSNSPICIGTTLELKASGGTAYSWTGPNGFASTDQNPIITNATIMNSGEYKCLITSNIGGCNDTKKINIVIQNIPPPTGNTNQPFCSGQNPTISDIQVTGNSIKWYDALNAGSVLLETTSLVNGKTYYASQTVNTCESQRFGITVSIVNTPSSPILSGQKEFCKTENATLNNIQITGQNLKWYDTSFSAAVLPNTTLLEDNKTYYISQTVGCESDRTPILVRVYDTALPTGSTSKQFCIDENATLASIGMVGTNLKWYDSAINGSNLPETTLLQNATYYATQTENNCESKRLGVTIKIQDTQPPGAVSPQTFCIQKNASINDIDVTGQNIKWFDSVSSDVNLSESTPLENGITYYASQTINSCESDRIPITIQILEATTGDCINFVDELPYPKYFTPNNDTFHDTWTIDFAYLAPNTGIQIFDRYGKFIKELHKDTAWDGNYLGSKEPASDYWFIVTRLNGKQFRGHFSLKR